MIEITVGEAITVIKPLAIFVLSIAIYSIFIFNFYRFIAKKDVFPLNLDKYNTSKSPALRKTLHFIFYVFKYILLFPIFSFFWFAILTILLSFLSKNSSVENILLVSIAVVGAVRITAYYNEDLSRDLGKMLPFALLGVFLVDISFFSFGNSIILLKTIPEKYSLLVYYLVFAILLEFVARILYGFTRLFKRKKKTENK